MQRVWEKRKVTSDTVAEGGPLIAHCKSVTGQIFVNNILDALFHVFIYSFFLSTCFKHHNAHHQENE
jgi:hypothetical protein